MFAILISTGNTRGNEVEVAPSQIEVDSPQCQLVVVLASWQSGYLFRLSRRTCELLSWKLLSLIAAL